MAFLRLAAPLTLAATLLLSAGCAKPPPPAPTGTGAREVCQQFLDALVRRDWAAAHAKLASDTLAAWPAARFGQRMEAYFQQMGFQPSAVELTACSEKGSEAMAHVVFTGRDGKTRRRFKETFALHRTDVGWGAALPTNFGRKQ